MVEYYNRWGIDEIILLDIDATTTGRSANPESIARYARLVQVPFSVGGGIRCLQDIERLVRVGANMVFLIHAEARSPSLLSEASHLFVR